MDKAKLGRFEKLGYGFGNLGYSAVSQTLSTLIMFFGTSVAGIPGTLVGLCIAIGTVWDALTDPIVGFISDSAPAGGNRRRIRYISLAGLFMALSNMLLWSVPINLTNGQKFAWLLISLLCYETADTFFATPYTALGYEMACNDYDTTSLQAIKSVFYLFGMLLPSILMFFFMPDNTSRISYIKIGLFNSILVIITTLFCIIAIRPKNKKITFNFPIIQKKTSFWNAFLIFFDFFKNKDYMFVILGYSISTIATAMLTSLGIHVFTYSFHFTSTKISLLMMLLILGATVSQLFLTKISQKLGKMQTLIKFIIITLLGIGLIWCVFTLRTLLGTQINFYLCCPLLFVCGFGSGALYSLPFSIFSDIIKQENENKKTNQTATYCGVMTFVFKLSNAVSLFVIGVILDIIKFNSAQPVQPLKVQNALGITMLMGVALSLTVSILFFAKYKKNN